MISTLTGWTAGASSVVFMAIWAVRSIRSLRCTCSQRPWRCGSVGSSARTRYHQPLRGAPS